MVSLVVSTYRIGIKQDRDPQVDVADVLRGSKYPILEASGSKFH